MGQTLVALYDSPEAAKKAVDALLSEGFTAGEVRIVNPADFGESAAPETDILGITGLVKPSVGEFEEAVRRGSSLVAVTSEQPDAARAEATLVRFQPKVLDHEVAQWKTAGWKNPYDSVRDQSSMSIYDSERAQTGRDRSPSTVQVFVW